MERVMKRIQLIAGLVVVLGGGSLAAAEPARTLVPCDDCDYAAIQSAWGDSCVNPATPCYVILSCTKTWDWVREEWEYFWWSQCESEDPPGNGCPNPYICMGASAN